VYIDPYGSHLLSNINTSRIRFAHPDLPQNICKALGIKKLSDVIVEVYFSNGTDISLPIK
jgi:sacsin